MKLLEVAGVSVSFAGLRALSDVSFTVEPGLVHGLIGPNGAGKTTLFNCISGLLRPDSGTILFEGRDLVRTPPHNMVGLGIARTFQNLALCKNLSVLDNVLLGTYHHHRASVASFAMWLPSGRRAEQEAQKEALSLLELVGCRAFADTIVQGLSYGILKRVEFARALACRPRFLLLDEPAAGLNSSERVELMRLITQTRSRGVTILLVEHDMGMVMSVCDQITVLNFGQVIAGGSPAEVRDNPEVIAAYLGVEGQETDHVA